MEETIIHAEDLMKVYRLPAEDVVAVDGVSVDIRRGDFVSLMGPSGSGKTTLLDLLGCLDSITSGRLTVFGNDVSNLPEDRLVSVRRGGIGFVFQEFLLMPELSAIENVELPMTFARIPVDRSRSRYLLERVGLGHRADHLPRELSGGERQRVDIARSLAASPAVLLADEPTGNLDTGNSREIYSTFERLNAEDGVTIVVATHDEGLGSRADRVIKLVDGRTVS
jgi:putative ABC transport system ATP-binding protein